MEHYYKSQDIQMMNQKEQKHLKIYQKNIGKFCGLGSMKAFQTEKYPQCWAKKYITLKLWYTEPKGH